MTAVYITKYALTAGPFKVDADISHGGSMASYKVEGSYPQHAHGKDFWLTPEDALRDCERRRRDKLRSIAKQAQRLADLEFIIEVAKQ